MEESKNITVAKLIKLLQECSQHKKVRIEGCDCYGPAASVEENEVDISIMRVVEK